MNYTKPKRTFELSGPVSPDKSYFVPLEGVTNDHGHEIDEMIDLGRYISIFAPEQSGKTTCVEHFCRELEKDPAYIPILLRFRGYEALDGKTFYKNVEKSLYSRLIARLKAENCPELSIVQEFLDAHELTSSHSYYRLFRKLNEMIASRKIAIFIDDFDSFPLDELESFLSTTRAMNQDFKMKKKKALHLVGLISVRNITKGAIRHVSPYNISDWVNLTSFTLENIRDLYAQYTQETNQPFEEAAVEKIFEETAGQPWLVNRLGTILTTNIKPETTDPITAEDADEAVSLLLKEKNPHFHKLLGKLRYLDTFLKIAQRPVEYFPNDDELSHLMRHGLIKRDEFKAVVANPIYKKRFTKPPPQ